MKETLGVRPSDSLVSVIMPAFNSEAFIVEAIESVMAQSHSDLELIIVVDGGHDGTAKIVKSFCELDSRASAVYHEFNLGIAEARNSGLKIASGRYIAFCDSDDAWLPDKLSIQLDLMRKNNIGVCHASAYLINDRGNSIGVRNIPKRVDLGMMKKRNFIINSSGILDKSFFNHIAQHNINSEDYDMWLRLLSSEKISLGADKPLVKYRVHVNSITPNLFRSLLWTVNVQRKNGCSWIGIFFGLLYNVKTRIFIDK